MQTESRTGDKVQIDGNYQHRALYQGSVIQRTWHRLKLSAAVAFAQCNNQSTILDVGCGSGTIIPFLGENRHSYLGVDANEKAIGFCQAHYTDPNLTFKQLLFDDLCQLPVSSFSHIFFLETIEHITHRQGEDVLSIFHQLLKEDGVCIISTPNRKSAWPFLEKLLDLFKLTPRMAGDQHELLYSKKELIAMANSANFTVQRVSAFNGLAPWLSILSTRTARHVHNWELKQSWWPGSLILIVIQKKGVSA